MKKWILLSAIVLVLTSCHKENKPCPGPAEKTFAITGFSGLAASETFTVTVTRGSNYGVFARGCASDLAELDLSVGNGQLLNINYSNYKPNRNRVDFTITVPRLTSVNLTGASKISINGFKDQNSVIRTVLSGNASCALNGAPIISQVDLSDNSGCTISGNTENLYGNISGNAVLQAYAAPAIEVDIDVSGNATAYVMPTHKLFAAASDNSRIYYKGDPAGKLLDASGNAKIIRE